jgi:glyoxylase-like metal-dependent hydrolase (beta-lactamase superfamily II)
MPLPARPGHVHCYLLAGDDGWTLVDTGVGLPDAAERWAEVLHELDGPVVRIFVTHFHPDHVGAAADVHSLTGAPVIQGSLDYEQCELVWGSDRGPELADWLHRQGAPDSVTRELMEEGALYRLLVRFQRDPLLVGPGDSIDGWELVAAPGHADGQLCLLRDGVLVAGDHILDPISPTVGLWPASRPDPLGDYFESLLRTVELAPRLALPGHGEPIADPAGRAQSLLEHHRERLDETEAALGSLPRSGYELSCSLFGADLEPLGRRFAIAETLSHCERLVLEGRAERREDGEIVTYTAT